MFFQWKFVSMINMIQLHKYLYSSCMCWAVCWVLEKQRWVRPGPQSKHLTSSKKKQLCKHTQQGPTVRWVGIWCSARRPVPTPTGGVVERWQERLPKGDALAPDFEGFFWAREILEWVSIRKYIESGVTYCARCCGRTKCEVRQEPMRQGREKRPPQNLGWTPVAVGSHCRAPKKWDTDSEVEFTKQDVLEAMWEREMVGNGSNNE